MTPRTFEQANVQFGPPPDMTESQCHTIAAHRGTVQGGSLDGETVIVTAWYPSPEELAEMQAGHPVFLTVVGNALPPHMLTTNFKEATNPQ